MNINLICIGKLKEKYWQDASAEYIKRLGAYCNVKIIELKEAKLPANAGAADEDAVKSKEGEAILSRVGKDDFVIAMAIEGKQYDSPALAGELRSVFDSGKQTIDFVIGGSLGLSDAVKKRADRSISFSKLTFPHQLFRVMLLEQIYRAYKINGNEIYHK